MTHDLVAPEQGPQSFEHISSLGWLDNELRSDESFDSAIGIPIIWASYFNTPYSKVV